MYEEVYHEIKEAAMEIGLHINIGKTTAIIMPHTEVNVYQCLNTGGHNVELVNSFAYL
jgi:hypothetical protein